VAVEHGDRRERERVERLDRLVERVRDQRLRAVGELVARQVADVVAGRERRPGRRDEQAACVEVGQRRRERVEDLVVERVALAGVVDRQPRDVIRRVVQTQLAAGEVDRPYSSTTRVSPSETD
jgi:hypothetical protein